MYDKSWLLFDFHHLLSIPENIPNLIHLVDIMNQACELSIYDEIADYKTDWYLWEQENNKIDIYSELLKFAYEHSLEDMVDHCIIRLARKILTWSENTSMDVFAELQRKAKDSRIFEDLLRLAEEVMSRRN